MSTTSSNTISGDIRVQAWPQYLAEHSDPDQDNYLFGYRIRITNEGERTVMLVSRHWVIINFEGEREEVEGLGVVGRQPVLEPGESFQYESFCPLNTRFGTMEGEFRFLDDEGASFSAIVGRFFLVAELKPGAVTTS